MQSVVTLYLLLKFTAMFWWTFCFLVKLLLCLLLGCVVQLFKIEWGCLSYCGWWDSPSPCQSFMLSICSSLPLWLFPIGIPSGLEAAIHRSAFLDGVCKKFPEISSWVNWCYSQPAKLRFSHKHILASQVSNKGILLVPYFFPWYWCNLFVPYHLLSNVWYLDDGNY